MKFSILPIIAVGFILQTASIEASPLQEMVDGGNLLMNAIQKLEEIIGSSPMMKKIKDAIAKIDVSYDQLKRDEVALIKEALMKLSGAEAKFTILRVVLNELADVTKTRVSSIVNLLNGINPNTVRVNKKIKILHRRFMNTIKRSLVLLKKAQDEYKAIIIELGQIDGKLAAFSKQIDIMKNEHSGRYKAYAKRLRTEAYAGSAACVVVPVSCPGVYAVAAGVVESRLKEYKDSVNRLKSKCDSAKETANTLKNTLEKQSKQYSVELSLIINWESKVDDANSRFENFDFFAEEVEEFKDDVMMTLRSLTIAADNFSKSIKNSELGQWIENNQIATLQDDQI